MEANRTWLRSKQTRTLLASGETKRLVVDNVNKTGVFEEQQEFGNATMEVVYADSTSQSEEEHDKSREKGMFEF
jgi:hypothetical protein